MPNDLPHDVQLLLMGLCIIGGLLLIALIRILLLSRANRRMRMEAVKMEKLAMDQQIEVTAIHHDAMSWRAKSQRQFDAFRADLSHRLIQSDQSCQHAQKLLDSSQHLSLSSALAKIGELEARSTTKTTLAPFAVAALPDTAALPRPVGMVQPPTQVLPALPAMETLRQQALESELAAAKAEIIAGKRQNAALQHALLLARRRQQPVMRKNLRPGPAHVVWAG